MTAFIELIQTLISGISIGCIYGLVALGLVMLFKATEVLSFVHGEIMMMGAFIAYSCVVFFNMPYVFAFLSAVIFTGLLGVIIERLTIRPLIGEPVFSIVMVTIGLGYIFKALVSSLPFWGSDTYTISTPFTNKYIRSGELAIAYSHLFIILSSIALIIILALFFKFTKIGIAMRATSQNQLAAVYMGIGVTSVFSVTWGVTAALGGIAGVLIAPITLIHMNMGNFVIKAFPAAILGGFSSIPGAIIGELSSASPKTSPAFIFPKAGRM